MSVHDLSIQQLLQRFCQQQSLPDTYGAMAQRWFVPLAQSLNNLHGEHQGPVLVGINGCQGSGKSTLAALLVALIESVHHKKALALSIDEFYLTRAQRQSLAVDIHPLFKTRGVPGTHDLNLLQSVLHQLRYGQGSVAVPRFNKATDDRFEVDHWDSAQAPIDIVLLEGWCVGATAQPVCDIPLPVNQLEREEDSDAVWRSYSNNALASEYSDLFNRLDTLMMLRAPSFQCVYQWRKKQEQKLRDSTVTDSSAIMSDDELSRFIEHYQRITEHALRELPGKANTVFALNEAHHITQRYDNHKNSDNNKAIK